ncbi:hypothetical protein DV515_00017164 [Chloebia gouldiae]|uniref:Uncharacterized protein n=1 Tax=Chloebia gouldiae TaxID=44316 RepID=A0A3L8R0Z5_CHLGU|nr:hypothetical protein DV515_00017164 [Chloebia gouldiae]
MLRFEEPRCSVGLPRRGEGGAGARPPEPRGLLKGPRTAAGSTQELLRELHKKLQLRQAQ